MFNQYIKIGIQNNYFNHNYSNIVDYIGIKFRDEITGNNHYGNKGVRKIIQTVKNGNPNVNISKKQVRSFSKSFSKFTREKYLKIPRENTILILNTIVLLIKDDKYAIDMFEKYCNENNINEISRIYRTVLIPNHYNELKNNVNEGRLSFDDDAVNVYEKLKNFTEKYKE